MYMVVAGETTTFCSVNGRGSQGMGGLVRSEISRYTLFLRHNRGHV